MFPPFISKRFGATNGVAIYSYIFTAFALASILGYAPRPGWLKCMDFPP